MDIKKYEEIINITKLIYERKMIIFRYYNSSFSYEDNDMVIEELEKKEKDLYNSLNLADIVLFKDYLEKKYHITLDLFVISKTKIFDNSFINADNENYIYLMRIINNLDAIAEKNKNEYKFQKKADTIFYNNLLFYMNFEILNYGDDDTDYTKIHKIEENIKFMNLMNINTEEYDIKTIQNFDLDDNYRYIDQILSSLKYYLIDININDSNFYSHDYMDNFNYFFKTIIIQALLSMLPNDKFEEIISSIEININEIKECDKKIIQYLEHFNEPMVKKYFKSLNHSMFESCMNKSLEIAKKTRNNNQNEQSGFVKKISGFVKKIKYNNYNKNN